MAIEIVDLPINSMMILHSELLVYQRVYIEYLVFLGTIISWWFQPLWKILVTWDYYSKCMEQKHLWNHQPYIYIYTLWLFNIAMENGPFIDDFPIKTSIHKGFSMAMLNNQRVYIEYLVHGDHHPISRDDFCMWNHQQFMIVSTTSTIPVSQDGSNMVKLNPRVVPFTSHAHPREMKGRKMKGKN